MISQCMTGAQPGPELADGCQHACKLCWRRHHSIMTGSYFLPFPVFLLLDPLPRSLKRTVDRVGAGDVGARSIVRHEIVDPHGALIRADRMRGEATFHPICRGVVLGNAERGRRWQRNEDALPLLCDGLAPGCHDIWRQYTEYALAILEDDAVEIDEVPNAVGDLVAAPVMLVPPKLCPTRITSLSSSASM